MAIDARPAGASAAFVKKHLHALPRRLTFLILAGPVLFGLAGICLPAFGYFPALGGESLSLEPWEALLETPGLESSLLLSFGTGLAATLLSVLLTLGFFAAWQGSRAFRLLHRFLSPLLSVPHAAMTFGLLFLLAPSGWLLRFLSPWLTGFDRPPDWFTVNDPAGLSLVLALLVKEVPFLFLMTLAALNQVDDRSALLVARTTGHGPVAAWAKAVLPLIWPQIRLPVLAVLAFSLSVVDVALIIGPSTPPPLAVLLLRWTHDPDLSLRFVAAAGAMLQCGLVLVAVALCAGLERLVRKAGLAWITGGFRWQNDRLFRLLLLILAAGLFLIACLGLLSMGIWSVAGFWTFPDILPGGWSVRSWERQLSGLLSPLLNSLWIGGIAAIMALIPAILCLEFGQAKKSATGRHALQGPLPLFFYLPLLVPQISFLTGLQLFLIIPGLDGTALAVLWSHLVFVLPYIALSLSEPWQRWDHRYGLVARCLGDNPWRAWWRVKAPMLLRPTLIALAVGFSVSIAQYLPTLLAGGGRFPTLTTEAVALSSGGNRRVIGIYTFLLMIMPFTGFCLALAIPARIFRHRRGLRNE